MIYKIGIAADATSCEVLQDKLLGYPLAGVQVGGGVHVAMPATWDGTGSVPVGWTSYRGSSLKHPGRNEWATPIDPESSIALGGIRKDLLTQVEQARLTGAIASAVDLPVDWRPSQPAANGAGLADRQGGRER